MQRLYLVDDEPLSIDRMVELCSRLDGVEVVGTALTGKAAILEIPLLQPDILLIDVTMPGLDGFEILGALRFMPRMPGVVFVTAHDAFAVRAFDVAAADYLLKPVEIGRLKQALQRAAADRAPPVPAVPTSKTYATELWAPAKGGSLRLPVQSIIHVEAQRDYVKVYTATNSGLLGATLTDLSRQLDPDLFVRVHRSFLVSRQSVVRMTLGASGRRLLKLSSGACIPIGRTYIKALWPGRTADDDDCQSRGRQSIGDVLDK